jgi:tetratricopeptide (TPR) repeat protein
MLAERAKEALPLLEEAIRHGTTIGQISGQPTRLARLAECYLYTGRRVEAEQPARQALALAREQCQQLGEALSLRTLGMIAARALPPDTEIAQSALGQARDLAAARGMRPFVAQCQLELGKLYQRIGERAPAFSSTGAQASDR